MQILQNGIEVPTNSDPYNLTADLAEMGDSINVIIPVVSKAARDALTKHIGLTVTRLDLLGLPIQIWDGSKWGGPPRGQLAISQNTFTNVFGTTKNYLAEINVTAEPDRLIEVTAQVEAASNANGIHATYTINLGGASGTISGTALKATNKRYNLSGLGEGFNGFSVRQPSGAGGLLRFSLQGQVVVGSGTVTSGIGSISITATDIGAA